VAEQTFAPRAAHVPRSRGVLTILVNPSQATDSPSLEGFADINPTAASGAHRRILRLCGPTPTQISPDHRCLVHVRGSLRRGLTPLLRPKRPRGMVQRAPTRPRVPAVEPVCRQPKNHSVGEATPSPSSTFPLVHLRPVSWLGATFEPSDREGCWVDPRAPPATPPDTGRSHR
jgi:hypothetical protein